MGSEIAATIPTVDLSPFFHEGVEIGRKQAMDIISNACQTYGFFKIVNHGIPRELMARAIELSRVFFNLSDDEKLKLRPTSFGDDETLELKPTTSKPYGPAGYTRQPDISPNKNEFLMLFSPELGCNVYPTYPPEFSEILKECYIKLSSAAWLVEGILSESMGLPPNLFKDNRSKDRSSFRAMAAVRYFPATALENIGVREHQDPTTFTFVFQDDVGGLELLKDGEWIPVEPSEDSITVNIGDIIQVLSNNKFKSAMHRVVRKEKHRHSFAFFSTFDGEEWIEPLPQFTREVGKAPEYKGFSYKDYNQLRMRNVTHPPSKTEDFITISHYKI